MRGWSHEYINEVSSRGPGARRAHGLRTRARHDSQWAAIGSIASKLGMTPETLRKWVRRAETDQGLRPGLSTSERERLRELERENRELRRANEILKAAAAFFGAELDRRPRR